MNLTCGENSVIGEFLFASFGTPTGTCGTFQLSDCNAKNTIEYVSKLCSGNKSCVIPADPTIRNTHSPLEQILGDPCFGTQKHLAVQAKCIQTGPPPPRPGPTPAALPIILTRPGSSVLFDFGKEVGGITTLHFGSVSGDAQSVLISYSESSLYALGGDESNGGRGPDGYISSGIIKANGSYEIPVNHMRGGFRYMQIVLATDGIVEIKLPSLYFTATPNLESPADWRNHFYSSDDLLNKIWYAAGYTTQLCSIDPQHGRQWGPPTSGWNNNATCGVGDTVLVDGAKRDRVIWPGDMGVSVLTALATTGDVDASANAELTLYQHQQNNGMLPYAGPPVNFDGSSDTYHLWALIGTYHVSKILSMKWLSTSIPGRSNTTIWQGYTNGVAASVSQISNSSGLFNVVHPADWARRGQGGENIAANCLLYCVLKNAAELASALEKPLAAEYDAKAKALKESINERLWDANFGAYRDNTVNSDIHPQDGNSLAVWFNVTSSPAQVVQISDYLANNWNSFGSQTPEWNNDIGTFPGSMEVHAHGAAGNTSRMHDLIRLMWGYMLKHNQSTHSTFWEGYHSDGSFSYRGSYMSNAHGWATGPASALTMHTLGIQHGQHGGYVIKPNPGDLAWAQGRFHFDDEEFLDVKWQVLCATETASIRLQVDASSMHVDRLGRVELVPQALVRQCGLEVLDAVVQMKGQDQSLSKVDNPNSTFTMDNIKPQKIDVVVTATFKTSSS